MSHYRTSCVGGSYDLELRKDDLMGPNCIGKIGIFDIDFKILIELWITLVACMIRTLILC